mmetsp:Transcript_36893/g.51236  ORF Transcript_36893/g.51236 Transcript_36893/m.51236 type:complete len:276 (+) Transcript_36893:77-904(+)
MTHLRTAISWTGGKDSNLALLISCLDPKFDVVALVVFKPENAAFRAHPIELMEVQARSLGLPMYEVIVSGNDTDSYKNAYVNGIRSLSVEHKIEVLVTGDMDLVGSMKHNWIEECCKEVINMQSYLPLWEADRMGVLKSLLDEDFKIVFSCVKSPWFTCDWVGKQLRWPVVKELINLQDTSDLDLGGERGEYHTMCLNGPLYTEEIVLQDLAPEDLGANVKGKKTEDTWWALKSSQVKNEKFNKNPNVLLKCLNDADKRLTSIKTNLGNNLGSFL